MNEVPSEEVAVAQGDPLWRAIPGFEGAYEIAEDGRVRSWKSWGRCALPRMMKVSYPPNGRRAIQLGLRGGVHDIDILLNTVWGKPLGKRLSYGALLERAIRYATGREWLPRWSYVGNMFGLGSSSARDLCKRFELDPDELRGIAPDEEEPEENAEPDVQSDRNDMPEIVALSQHPGINFPRTHELLQRDCTTDPIFLFQQRRVRFCEAHPWDWDPDDECLRDAEAREVTDDDALEAGYAVEEWETVSVFLTRAAGEHYGQTHAYNYPEGWRVFCVHASGDLARVLAAATVGGRYR